MVIINAIMKLIIVSNPPRSNIHSSEEIMLNKTNKIIIEDIPTNIVFKYQDIAFFGPFVSITIS